MPPPFRREDWLDDCEWFFSEQEKLRGSGATEFPEALWSDHFQSKYPNDAASHRRRFGAAMRYLERYSGDFGTASFAIDSTKTAVVATPVLLALHIVYTRCDDEMVSQDCPISVVLDYARQCERNT